MHNEQLIEAVRNYSFLYNQEDKSYSDNDKKDAAWKEIGKILNEPAQDCKKQWNSLRDCCRRSLKKKKDTKRGQAAKKIKKWKYDDEMSFLTPYIKERETVTAVDVHESSNELDDDKTTEDNSNLIQRSESPRVSDAPIETVRKKIKKKTGAASGVLMDYILSNTNKTVNNEQQSLDDIDLFFKSIALTVKKLSPYNQIIAKARVSSLISDLQIQELSNTNRQYFSSDSINTSVVSTPIPSPYTREPPQTTNPQQPTTSYPV